MKKLLLILLCLPMIGFGQDNILLQTGEEILSKVIEVNQDLIKYKKHTNLEGPIYSIDIKNVFMIKYANGEKDIFRKNEYDNNVDFDNGKNAADTLHSAGPSFVGGVVFGIPGGLVINSVDAYRLPPFYAEEVSDMYQNNRNFEKGYKMRAKQKNVTAGWIGAGIGTIAAILIANDN